MKRLTVGEETYVAAIAASLIVKSRAAGKSILIDSAGIRRVFKSASFISSAKQRLIAYTSTIACDRVVSDSIVVALQVVHLLQKSDESKVGRRRLSLSASASQIYAAATAAYAASTSGKRPPLSLWKSLKGLNG